MAPAGEPALGIPAPAPQLLSDGAGEMATQVVVAAATDEVVTLIREMLGVATEMVTLLTVMLGVATERTTLLEHEVVEARYWTCKVMGSQEARPLVSGKVNKAPP